MKSLYKYLLPILLIACSTLFLGGCGSKGDPELTAFKETMNTFFEDAASIDSQLNALDPNEEGAIDQMLALLDELNEKCQALSEIEVPEEFSNVSAYTESINFNMSHAVEKYHEAFSNDAYNENIKDVADEYYARANGRIHDMILLLHGEIPTGEDVIYTTEADETN
ncbi:MAG: lipoprotein [Lachnospiraceae bacterium]|nr:lipoprotein [Lachnospiraceae bacterium]